MSKAYYATGRLEYNGEIGLRRYRENIFTNKLTSTRNRVMSYVAYTELGYDIFVLHDRVHVNYEICLKEQIECG